MKKTFIYLFALLAVTMFTACDSENNDVTKQTFTTTINNRAVDGQDVVFSQGSANVEIDYTNRTILLASDYKDMMGNSHTLNTGVMKLTGKTVVVCSFASTNVTGYIDLSTGMMLYVINSDEGYNVYCSTQLVWPYVTTTIVNEQGGTYSHTQSGYVFVLDSKCENAVMQVTDYIPDTGGAVQEAVIEYRNLSVMPTTTGYEIVADEATCSQSSYYNLTDLHVNITGNGQLIDGSFKIKGNTYKMSGTLFGDITQ